MLLKTLITKVETAKKKKLNKEIYLIYSTCPCDNAACYHYMQYVKHTKNSVFLKDVNDIVTEFYADDARSLHGIELLMVDFHKKFRQTIKPKKPSTDSNYVGVELEFISKLKPTDISRIIIEAGLDEFLTVKDDGSVKDEKEYPYSFELNVLAKNTEVYGVVKKLCDLIGPKSKVNDSCGLHIHLDMRNRDAESAYKNLYSAQNMFYAMVHKKRFDNTFCRPSFEYNPVTDDEDERYRCVNKCSMSRYKTLEIRVHHGSLNGMEICNWIRLLHKIVDADTVTPKLITSLSEVKKAFRLDPATMKYIAEACEMNRAKRADLPFEFEMETREAA